MEGHHDLTFLLTSIFLIPLTHFCVHEGKDSSQKLSLREDLISRTLPSQVAFSPLSLILHIQYHTPPMA